MLFRYSALTGNGHRIHYDQPYAMQDEGYPGLVVHGPLQATFLAQTILEAAPGLRLVRFAFRGRRPAFAGNPLTVLARVEGDQAVAETRDGTRRHLHAGRGRPWLKRHTRSLYEWRGSGSRPRHRAGGFVIITLADVAIKYALPTIGVAGALLWRGVAGGISVVILSRGRGLMPRNTKLILARSFLHCSLSRSPGTSSGCRAMRSRIPMPSPPSRRC
jgi:acyl dehydratase